MILNAPTVPALHTKNMHIQPKTFSPSALLLRLVERQYYDREKQLEY